MMRQQNNDQCNSLQAIFFSLNACIVSNCDVEHGFTLYEWRYSF